MLLACLWLLLATSGTTARRHQRHKSFSSDMEELAGYRRMAAFNEHSRDKSARSVPRKEIHIWGKRTISDSSLSLGMG